MQATIINYRRSRKTTYNNQMIIKAKGMDTREKAEKLIGKKVVYNTGKKEITGKISAVHGNKGALRALFETGMPGQAIGRKIEIG